jgi:hypothetical protein
MSKIHFIEGDTDSMYWAVSGDPVRKEFKDVILDEKFYNENIYKWASSSFYTTDNSNPTFANKLEQTRFDKKIGGLEIEKQCDNMIALAPKMYTCFDGDLVNGATIAARAKGVKTKQNPLTKDDYIKTLQDKTVILGSNTNLQLHNFQMSKINVSKNILTAAHTKYKVSEDFSTCTPLLL